MFTRRQVITAAVAAISLIIAVFFRAKLHPFAEAGFDYVWPIVYGGYAVFFFALAGLTKKDWLLYPLICLGSLLAGAFLLETLLIVRQKEPGVISSSTTSKHMQDGVVRFERTGYAKDPDLGFGPDRKALKIASRKVKGDIEVFDSLYTSLEDGSRITPQRGDAADTALVFFGCSFTYGDGINDNETYPYIVGERLGEKYQCFNFAYHGYGAHQMLAQIEGGILDDIVKRYRKVQTFFLTINGHEERCSFPVFRLNGPRYVLKDGKAVRDGNLISAINASNVLSYKKIRRFFNRSKIFSFFQVTYPVPRGLTEDMMWELHCAIMDRAAEICAEKYHAPMTVLIYPCVPNPDKIAVSLPHATPVVLAPRFPDFAAQPDKYVIKYDSHPNPRANVILADTVCEIIAHPSKDKP